MGCQFRSVVGSPHDNLRVTCLLPWCGGGNPFPHTNASEAPQTSAPWLRSVSP